MTNDVLEQQRNLIFPRIASNALVNRLLINEGLISKYLLISFYMIVFGPQSFMET